MKKETKVYFIRHGEAEPKKEGIVNKDPRLTNQGKKQAGEVAKQLFKIKKDISKIYTSNLSRAIETSKIIENKIKIKAVQKKEFRELNRYFFEGKFWTPRFWKYYFSYKRACNEFNKILKENEGKTVVFVIHGRRAISLIGYKLGLSIKQMLKMISFSNGNFSHIIMNGLKLSKIRYLNSNGLQD